MSISIILCVDDEKNNRDLLRAVLVPRGFEVVEAAEQTSGGVLLTDGAKEKPTMGKVVAVGGGREDDDGKAVKPSVEVGSTVLYQRYSGAEFEGPNDKQYIVVRDADILATMA